MSNHDNNSLITITAIALLWYAHKRKHEERTFSLEDRKTNELGYARPSPAPGLPTLTTNNTSSTAEEEAVDPMRYTTLQVFCLVPAVLGLATLVSRHLVRDDETTRREMWRRLLEQMSVGELLRASYFVQMMLYFGLGSAFLAVDLTKTPDFVYRNKIQKRATIDYYAKLPKLFAVLTLNLGLPGLAFLVKRLLLLLWGRRRESTGGKGGGNAARVASKLLRKYLRFDPELPSVGEVSLHTAAFLMMYDLLFFYSHKWLHHRSVYAAIHKLHHEWKSPTALAAAYAHPVEHLLSNLLPGAVGILVLRPHFLTFNVFTLLGLLITLLEHSGYELVDTHAFHNLHHEKFQDNYGTFFWWDEWYGTRIHPLVQQ